MLRGLISLVGIALVIFGIGILGYKGFSYKSEEKVAQIGNLQVTAENDKMVYFNPTVGIVSVLAGVVLVFVGMRK